MKCEKWTDPHDTNVKQRERERKKEKKKQIASAHLEIELMTFRSAVGRSIHWATKADGE